MRVFRTPAVEDDFRILIGNEVIVSVRDKKQVRGRSEPHSTKSDRNSAAEVCLVPKNRFLLESSITIRVLKDNDPVPGLTRRIRVIRTLQHPETAAVIHREGDRLRDFRLPCDALDSKARKHLHVSRSLRRIHGCRGGDGPFFVLRHGRHDEEQQQPGRKF